MKRIAVFGAGGKMGMGIAETLVSKIGCEVFAFDVSFSDTEILAKSRQKLWLDLYNLRNEDKKLFFQSVEEVNAAFGKVNWLEMNRTLVSVYLQNCDAVLEAIFEDENKKIELYGMIEKYAKDDIPIYTNTSTIKISRLAENLKVPDRLMGLHFFNPVPVMKPVEGILHADTSSTVVRIAKNLSSRMGKKLIFAPDVPGFVVNGGDVPMIMQTIEEIKNGADIEDIDKAFTSGRWVVHPPARRIVEVLIKESESLVGKYKEDPRLKHFSESQARESIENLMKLGTNMPAGPFELNELLKSGKAEELLKSGSEEKRKLYLAMGPGRFIDLVGIDVALDCVKSIAIQDPSREWKEPELLLRMRAEKKLGQKSGKGFYNYESGAALEYPEPGYARIVFGEGKRNSLSAKTIKELRAAFAEAGKNKDLKAIILQSRGRNFATGADIGEFPLCLKEEEIRKASVGEGCFLMEDIADCPVPVIAAVEGYALGGGYELALSCDMIVAKEGSKVGLPEKGLGILPGWGGTQRLPRRVGLEKAIWMILGAEDVKAEIPWVDFVLKKDDFNWETLKKITPAVLKRKSDPIKYDVSKRLSYAKKLIEVWIKVKRKEEPEAMLLALRAIWHGNTQNLDAGLKEELRAILGAFETKSAEDGVRCFIETGKHKYKHETKKAE